MTGDDTAQLIYLGLLVAALAGWLAVEFRKRGSQVVRTGLAWGLILVGLMAGYGLWQDIRQDILPVQKVAEGEVAVPRAEDGHYYPVLTIAGQEIAFMADTGATAVVLSPRDARRLGIDPDSLVYLGQAMTANGLVRTARVMLPDVRFGPFADAEVAAEVTESGMDRSLLGMDYLGRFAVTMAGDEMVLRR
jgi:aspartyl protease family protein